MRLLSLRGAALFVWAIPGFVIGVAIRVVNERRQEPAAAASPEPASADLATMYTNLQGMMTNIENLNLALDNVTSKLEAAEAAAANSHTALQTEVAKLVTLKGQATENREKVDKLSQNAKVVQENVKTNTAEVERLQTEVTNLAETAKVMGSAATESESKLSKLEQLVKDVVPGDESTINNRLQSVEAKQTEFEKELEKGIGPEIKEDLQSLSDEVRRFLVAKANEAAQSFA